MPHFEVLAAEKIKDGQGTRGPFTVWKLGLKQDGEEAVVAEAFCPAGTGPPAVGTVVEGDIEKTDNPSWLDKFRPARKQGAGGGGFKPRDPAERRSIAMQHAQKCAVTILSVAAEHGDYEPPNAGDVVGQVKTIAHALFEQVQQAEGGA